MSKLVGAMIMASLVAFGGLQFGLTAQSYVAKQFAGINAALSDVLHVRK